MVSKIIFFFPEKLSDDIPNPVEVGTSMNVIIKGDSQELDQQQDFTNIIFLLSSSWLQFILSEEEDIGLIITLVPKVI